MLWLLNTVISDLSSKYKTRKKRKKNKEDTLFAHASLFTLELSWGGKGTNLFCTVANKEVTLMPHIRNVVGLYTRPQVIAMGFQMFPEFSVCVCAMVEH